MELINHYPNDKQAINALNEKISIIHGEYISLYLDKLNCSKEQKIRIVDNIRGKI